MAITNAPTSTSEIPCTTPKSFSRAAWINAAPIPLRLNACSTTAHSANSDVTVIPTTVVIGIEALRSTWRRTTSGHGMPRLTAVCTCSSDSSDRTVTRVTRVTTANADAAKRDRRQA